MAEPAMRVALLARPGAACDNLQAALREAGAEVVLVADPTSSDAGTLAASAPQAVLVALEPSVEDALDGYQDLLRDPGTIVIYDEVAVAARREGWDTARWVRHLAAKLRGDLDVLPPGADADIQEAPSAPLRASIVPALEGAVPEVPARKDASRVLSLDEMTLVDSDAPRTRAATVGSTLSLDIDAPDEQGAVVVLAGIGGPDAVRQFLAALPTGFARPIIVRQRLDGGRHDRLVRQMQRATALPVELAQAGAALVAGHVYILPDGMATTHADGSTAFSTTDAAVPVLAGLPAEDSAILMLSGSDPAVVREVIAAAAAGALVAAQDPEECFDSAAPAALIAAGVESSVPAELARRLSTRWLSLKD